MFSARGHKAEGICTDLTNPHRPTEIKLEDGDLMVSALLAQETATMATETGEGKRNNHVTHVIYLCTCTVHAYIPQQILIRPHNVIG